MGRDLNPHTVAGHIQRRRVEWGETDAAGIVFYPNYFRWFDQATHELFRQLGLPLQTVMHEHGAGPVIMEARCQLLAPLSYDDTIDLIAVIAELRTKAIRVEHTVLLGEQIVARGHEVRIWARVSGGRAEPSPIPRNIRNILEKSREL